MPFYDTSAVPINQTVTSSTDCTTVFMGDFTRAMFGMREQVSIMRASELFATTGQVGFICHLRADFQVEFAAAFAVITGIRAA
jgi:HK97 family phage major capsid protein